MCGICYLFFAFTFPIIYRLNCIRVSYAYYISDIQFNQYRFQKLGGRGTGSESKYAYSLWIIQVSLVIFFRLPTQFLKILLCRFEFRFSVFREHFLNSLKNKKFKPYRILLMRSANHNRAVQKQFRKSHSLALNNEHNKNKYNKN